MRPIEPLHLCSETTTISEAINKINASGVGCVGIKAENGSLSGIITDGDLRRNYSQIKPDSLVTSIMTRNPIFLKNDDLAAKGLGLLSQKKITSLFVLDKSSKPIGLVHIHDFLDEGVI